jgi:hypothetical protein
MHVVGRARELAEGVAGSTQVVPEVLQVARDVDPVDALLVVALDRHDAVDQVLVLHPGKFSPHRVASNDDRLCRAFTSITLYSPSAGPA